MAVALNKDEARAELGRLTRAFVAHLKRRYRSGINFLPARAAPRCGVLDERVSVDQAGVPAVDSAVDELPDGVGSSASAPMTSLGDVRAVLGDCQRCPLGAHRRNLVFGVGSENAELMFVGEAPGADEDLQGEPFVGKAGQLLTKMINAMGLERDEVYIANIIKCRPPRNRDPLPEEIAACEPFLRRQIDVIGPRLIVALGGFAAKTLIGTETGITRLRGSWHAYQGIPLMPTFHPAYLLRNPDGKRPAWNDLQVVMKEMDRLGLGRRR
jgi:DNA polymerase